MTKNEKQAFAFGIALWIVLVTIFAKHLL